MAIAKKIRRYLESANIEYDTCPHDREVVSTRIARRANVPGDALAKGVLVKAEEGYLLAVVPASRHVDLSLLSRQLGQRLGLASEQEVEETFDDCDAGAVPACGRPYGMSVVVDDCLDREKDIYFEAGDHENLVHIGGDDWARMTWDAKHMEISHRD